MKEDKSYGDSPTRPASKIGSHGTEGHDKDRSLNEIRGHSIHERQETGGCMDNTPGQVGLNNVDAVVELTATRTLDSMGGSESRGKGNSKNEGY